MNLQPYYTWLVHSAGGGALLLLVACLAMKISRQPAWRQRLGEFGLAAALLLGVLTLGPSWLVVPILEDEPIPTDNTTKQAAMTEYLAAAAQTEEPRFAFLTPLEAPPDLTDPRTQAFFQALPAAPLPRGAAKTEAEVAGIDTRSSSPAASGDFPPPSASSEISTRPELDFVTTGTICLCGAHVCVAALLLGRWLIGHFALWRLLRRAESAPPAIAHLFASMVKPRHGCPRLLVSEHLRVPLSCGLWRPTVVLPVSFCASKAARTLPWVFAHELTHLERRDGWGCLLFGFGQAVFFFAPWFWWLRRQVRLCQEYVADAAASELAGDAEDYAEFLLALTRKSALPLGAIGVLGYSSDLFRRVTMLLQNPLPVQRTCSRWWSAAAACGLVALAVLVSGLSLRATAAPPKNREARVERDVLPLQDGEVRVDNVIVLDDDPAQDPKPEQPGDTPRPRRRPPAAGASGPGDDGGFDPRQIQEEIHRMQEHLQRLEQQLQRQGGMPMIPGGPAGGAMAGGAAGRPGMIGPGGMGRFPGMMAGPGGMQGFAFGGPHDGRLGVQIQPPGAPLADQLSLPSEEGLLIVSVTPKSAAAKAGIKANDILLEFDGKPVPSDGAKFARMVQAIEGKKSVSAVVVRKGKKITIEAIDLPEASAGTGIWGGQPGQFIFTAPGGGPGQGFGGLGGGGAAFGRGTGNNRSVTVVTNSDEGNFTTHYQADGLGITITGSVADNEVKVKQVTIQDKGEKHSYSDLGEVPDEYRDKVKNLLANIKSDAKGKEKRKDKKRGGILEEEDKDK